MRLFRNFALAVLPILWGASSSQAQTPPDANQLMQKFSRLDAECRGYPKRAGLAGALGLKASEPPACRQRDEAIAQLQAMNWCRGKGSDGAGYWIACVPEQRPTGLAAEGHSQYRLGQDDIPEPPNENDSAEVQIQAKAQWAAQTFRGALTAQVCQLRSDQWQAVMQNGVGFSWASAKQQSRVQARNPQEYDGYALALGAWIEAHAHPMGISRQVCANLVNSPEMDILDKIEWDLSGGYH